MPWRWRGKWARPRGRDRGPPQGLVGSSPAPGEAPQSHSPAARRPPRPGDGPGARGGCGGPSAAGTPALALTSAASAPVCVRRPPSARTRPLLRSPRGLGSRQGQKVNRPRIPPPSVPRTRRAMPAPATHWDSALPQALRTRAGTAPPLGPLNSFAAAG